MRSRKVPVSDVAPLHVPTERRVRFEEVDSMGIMWHGRYASWLEDGREALGQQYDVRYLDFYAHGVIVPLKIFHLEYIRPLYYNETYTINTYLLWNEAARMDFEYTITDSAGSCMTRAHTTQLMIDLETQLLLTLPEFYKTFLERWKNGAVL